MRLHGPQHQTGHNRAHSVTVDGVSGREARAYSRRDMAARGASLPAGPNRSPLGTYLRRPSCADGYG